MAVFLLLYCVVTAYALSFVNSPPGVSPYSLAHDLPLNHSPTAPFPFSWTPFTHPFKELRVAASSPDVKPSYPIPPLVPPLLPTAATKFVALSGSDENPGTQQAPWKTISHALSQLQPGDVLFISAGVYKENVSLSLSGTSDAPIYIVGDSSGRTVIDGSGGPWCLGASSSQRPPQFLRIQRLTLRNARTGIYLPPGSSHIAVENCEISFCRTALRCPQGTDLLLRNLYLHENGSGVVLGVKGKTGVTRVRIENCRAIYNRLSDRRANTDGFLLENPCRDVLIIGCEAAYSDDAGFDIKPPDAVLVQCWAHHNRGEGFKIWGARTRLVACVAVDNYDTGITMASSSADAQLWNCTIAFNTRCGLRPETNPIQRLYLRNCIIAFNPIRQYEARSGPGCYDGDYNLYFSPPDRPIWIIMDAKTQEGRKRIEYKLQDLKSGALPMGSHTIFADPQFRDVLTRDVHLLPSSPAVAAGCSLPPSVKQLLASPWPSPPCIGAYQLQRMP